jgi:CheY-like chemotaxis protein
VNLTNKEQNLVSKQKLLLADDSVTIQKVVNLTFADEGIEVISVGDGDSAMEKILETSPDLIMVDVNMPGLNGYEICEKLRNSETFRNTPVILLVGSFEPFDEEEAKRVGADDYLTKPFQSIRQLVQKVTVLLNENRSNGFVTPKTPEIEISTPIIETTQEIPFAEDKFAETLETYPSFVEDKKDDFGDVTNDDEMIQTSQFSTSRNIEIPRFESEPVEEISFKTESFDENKSNEVEQISEEDPKPYIPIETVDEPKPYIPVEHYTETIEPKPYIPIEHYEESEQPKPYQPIEHTFKIDEPKPYQPIEHTFEPDEPKPYIPFESYQEIPASNAVMTVDKNEEITIAEPNEVIEQPSDTHDVSLPEMASILQLDEQNLLEIAPREEDFIINMDHEQNSSADWDLIETRSFTEAQLNKNTTETVENKDFALVSEEAEVEQSTEKEIETKIEEAERVDLPAIEDEKVVEETENIEVADNVDNTEDFETDKTDELILKSEETFEPVAAEKEEVEEKNITDTATQSSENIVSVPNFIASTVVSEVAKENVAISEELIEVIVNRVMERLSDNVVREIAWEIVPSHTDLIIKKMVQEKLDKD